MDGIERILPSFRRACGVRIPGLRDIMFLNVIDPSDELSILSCAVLNHILYLMFTRARHTLHRFVVCELCEAVVRDVQILSPHANRIVARLRNMDAR